MSKKRNETVELDTTDLAELELPPDDPEPLAPELEPVSPAVAYPPVAPDAVIVPEERIATLEAQTFGASFVDVGNGFHPLTEQAAAKAYAIAAVVLNWPSEQPRWELLPRDEQAAWVSAASQVSG